MDHARSLDGETIVFERESRNAAHNEKNGYGVTTEWLTSVEAALYLKIDRPTLLHYARQGKVRAYILSGTQRHVWRFKTTDLDAMLTVPTTLSKIEKSAITYSLIHNATRGYSKAQTWALCDYSQNPPWVALDRYRYPQRQIEVANVLCRFAEMSRVVEDASGHRA